MSMRSEPMTRVDRCEDKDALFTPEVREQIDTWVAKYPEGWQQSACMAALMIVQDMNGGHLTRELMERGSPAYVYSLLLGAQTPFEHSTQADKFIYEAELRTGMGAHFRYADHLSAVLHEFLAQVPEARDWVVEGTAEPE